MRTRPDFTPSDPPIVGEQEFTPEECGWTYGGLTSMGHTVYEKPNGELHVFQRGKPCLIVKAIYEDGP